MKYEKERDFIVSAIHSAWEQFRDTEMDVKAKGAYDCVTNIDFGMEQFITAKIRNEFPQDRIIGEEFSPERGIPQGRAWVLDPIDGTVNMSHGLKLFGVQSAFFDGGEAVVSAIYIPYLDETYSAIKGQGAYLNGVRTYVAARPLDSAMVSVGDYSHNNDDTVLEQFNLISLLRKRVCKLRHLGAASIDYTNVASGRTDGFIMFTKNVWDIFPGLLLCTEAGAEVCAPDGTPYDYDTCKGVCVFAGNELVKLLKQ